MVKAEKNTGTKGKTERRKDGRREGGYCRGWDS